jgi:hypothetical protein
MIARDVSVRNPTFEHKRERTIDGLIDLGIIATFATVILVVAVACLLID